MIIKWLIELCHLYIYKMTTENNKIYCLAFDIERSGALRNHETIGIGASVVDQNFNELDSLFLPGYFPANSNEPTVFEDRCWDEFWSKHPEQLNCLVYDGESSKKVRQYQLISKFQAFRAKWEQKAKEDGAKYWLVSDNAIFDAGFINDMIFEHLPRQMPIPYAASDGEYQAFLETHSQQKGFLMSVLPEFHSHWGLTKKIAELYDVPEQKVEHDHRPDHDAYTIAMEQQILFGIRDGRISRKNDN